MAKQGCEKLGLDAFDALVRRARTCRRFDESMRVPREFLLELAEKHSHRWWTGTG